jgi:metabolite-proton symporter
METAQDTSNRVWSPRRVALAAMVGTTIEYYDFFIYGTAAALVLGPQFFPNVSSVAGTLAAFATFSVGFFARPLGGVVMGHYGDRLGRKRMLVFSLAVMGSATVLIGLLPNYATIGMAAPVLLVVLRFVQGFGVGGEVGGAILMSYEHAPRARRGIYGAFPMMGLPLGVVLSTGVYILVQAFVSAEAFARWGWRLPFLLALVIVIVGMLLRARVAESPEFTAAQVGGKVRKLPLVAVLRSSPKELVAGSLATIAAPTLGYLMQVYLLSYGTKVLKVPSSTMLSIIVISAVVWLVVVPVAGLLADRWGRKRMFVVGNVWMVIWAFPFFALLNTASFPLMLLAVVTGSVATAIITGVQGAILSEAFPIDVRYSGLSITVQVGTLLGGAVAPLAATALLASTGTSNSIALYMVGVSLVSLLGVLTLKSSPTRFSQEVLPDQAY